MTTQPREALHSSASNEWYTPPLYIEAARRALGGIDLDPASNATANQMVQATRYYTVADDGLARPWHGRVWLNPPYGRTNGKSNQALWSAKLIKDYCGGKVSQAVLLVNASPADKWFKPLWDFPICFTDHRIKFYAPGGKPRAPTHGNAFIYFGPDSTTFAQIFRAFGHIVGRGE